MSTTEDYGLLRPSGPEPVDPTRPTGGAGLYEFQGGEFWRKIAAWRRITPLEFGDHHWQDRHAVTSLAALEVVLGGALSPAFRRDVEAGLARTPMRIRLTPYLISLIDWTNPADDPIRRQFLPLGSQFLPDHPFSADDSLDEEGDRVTPHLIHRYGDRVLFLPLTICPVYCSFCTRSRLVGGSTTVKTKATYGASPATWATTFAYIRAHETVEDVVVSGGDAFMLRATDIETIGRTLLEIPHIRRLRFATRGLAALPMKVTSDDDWMAALARVNDLGRRVGKEVCVHTHFNADRELTTWTVAASARLQSLGIRVRNQSVLLRGVNDTVEDMHRLIKRLAFLQMQPYLVYLHDMVPGCEHLRTRLSDATRLFKAVLGTTAGFNVPRFVCDAPGGGGKREISSYDLYDADLGVSAWSAPGVKPGHVFYYFDPIDLLSDRGRQTWDTPDHRDRELAAFRARAEAHVGATDGRPLRPHRPE